MHELSIAMSIVETVNEAVKNQSDVVVDAVHVRVGALSNVVPEALEFAWSEATRGNRLDGSELVIEYVDAVVWCDSCQTEMVLPSFKLRCVYCGASTPEIRQGKELDILSVELSDVRETSNS